MTVFRLEVHAPGTSIAIGDRFVIKAGAYELRIIEIGGVSSADLYRRSGAVVTGGTVFPIVPWREGAPAASAVARFKPSISGGTETTIDTAIGGATPFAPKTDFTIAPGSSLILQWRLANPDLGFSVDFEELLLSWHF